MFLESGDLPIQLLDCWVNSPPEMCLMTQEFTEQGKMAISEWVSPEMVVTMTKVPNESMTQQEPHVEPLSDGFLVFDAISAPIARVRVPSGSSENFQPEIELIRPLPQIKIGQSFRKATFLAEVEESLYFRLENGEIVRYDGEMHIVPLNNTSPELGRVFWRSEYRAATYFYNPSTAYSTASSTIRFYDFPSDPTKERIKVHDISFPRKILCRPVVINGRVVYISVSNTDICELRSIIDIKTGEELILKTLPDNVRNFNLMRVNEKQARLFMSWHVNQLHRRTASYLISDEPNQTLSSDFEVAEGVLNAERWSYEIRPLYKDWITVGGLPRNLANPKARSLSNLRRPLIRVYPDLLAYVTENFRIGIIYLPPASDANTTKKV